MASRKLGSYVHLTDPDGVSAVFGPEDKLPSWASKLLDDAAKDAGVKVHPAYAADEAELDVEEAPFPASASKSDAAKS